MTWTAENLPAPLVEILDQDAGKAHSADGGVRASLARILNAYSGTETYRNLLEFVSWHFQCTRDTGSGDTVLECRTHGEIARWHVLFRDGELALMRAIGAHMDEVEHDVVC